MQPRMHDRRGAPMKIGLAVAKCCWHEMEMVTPATCGTQGGTHPPEKGRISGRVVVTSKIRGGTEEDVFWENFPEPDEADGGRAA